MRKNLYTPIRFLLVLVLCAPFAISLTQSPTIVQAQSDTDTVYLPQIENKLPGSCQNSPEEEQIIQFMRTNPSQRRTSLVCNPILDYVANQRAKDMATRNYFGHVNPDGYAANYLVRSAGYPLPSFYNTDDSGNNVESISAGYQTAQAAWSAWMASSGHQYHLLGLDPFYAEQTDVGVGYYYLQGSRYSYYWVVITARPE